MSMHDHKKSMTVSNYKMLIKSTVYEQMYTQDVPMHYRLCEYTCKLVSTTFPTLVCMFKGMHHDMQEYNYVSHDSIPAYVYSGISLII